MTRWERGIEVIKTFDHYPHYYLDYLGDELMDNDSLDAIKTIRVIYFNTYGSSVFDQYFTGEEAMHVLENLKIEAVDNSLITRVIGYICRVLGYKIYEAMPYSIVANTDKYSYGCDSRINGHISFNVSSI